MTERARSVHASAVKVGDHAVLIRGPSGAGKSRLAFDLFWPGAPGRYPPPFWSAMTVSISTQPANNCGSARPRN